MSEATICKDGHWIHTECRAYEAGKTEAEARIIKLLESNLYNRSIFGIYWKKNGKKLESLTSLIALIKGKAK